MSMENGYPIKRILVTGGCGFIGANFVRSRAGDRSRDRDHEPRRADLRRQPRQPRRARGRAALPVRPRRHRRPGAGDGAGGRGVRRDRPLRRREPRRPLDRRRHAVPADQRRRHPVPARRRAGGAGRPATSRSRPTRSTARSGPTTRRSPRRPRWPPTAPTPPARPGPTCSSAPRTTRFGLDTVITRCSNNYGPYQFPEKLIPLFITNALADIPLPVYGDGRQVRDWIHVLDHCRGVDAALRRGRAGRGLQLRRPERTVQHRRDPQRSSS